MQGRVLRIGAASLLVSLASVVSATSGFADGTATFSNAAAITINDDAIASPYPSPITVSGLAGKVADVNVTIAGFTHGFPDDVGIVLVGPGGQAMSIMNAAGSGLDVTAATMIFDDQAATQIPDLTAWSTGVFRPADYWNGAFFPAPGPESAFAKAAPAGSATLDGTFVGTNPNGVWSLYVRDFGAGDTGTISGGWSIQVTTDSTDPHGTITSGPNGLTRDANPTFTFSATEPATFMCSLDNAVFTACTSPKAYAGLSEGTHILAVQDTDLAQNVDPSLATRIFTVDTTAPTTSIDSGPSDVVTSSAASFDFSSSETASFQCKLDGGAFSDCTSPQGYSGLADGLHVFQLRATDAAGNADTTGASRAFTVQRALPGPPADTANPAASVTKPRVKKGKTKATISFTGADNSSGGLSFMCSLDGNAASTCTSPTTYKHLKPGTHSFFVVAQDPTGNLSAPATTSFKVRPKKK